MLDGQIAPSDEQRTATDQQSRDLTVKLVDFLKDYDAQKNPPVTDISSYGLFASSSEDLPDVPAIEFTGGADAWLTARFVELPFLPVVPEELRDYLPRQGGMSATQRPVPRMPFDDLPSITP
jgi:hypothetical protein